MDAKRKKASRIYAGLAVVSLLAGALADALFPRVGLPFLIAGFIGYLVCGGRAMALWPVRVGETVARGSSPHRPTPTHRIAAAAVFLAFALPVASMSAQQTIFNVPSADVLDPGKVYLEVDELFRPTDPKFSSTTVRGVVGSFRGSKGESISEA